MSASAPTLPDPQTAYATLFDGVHAEVFFTKLAHYGHTPRTEQEAFDLLQLAGRLRIAPEIAEKQASSVYGEAVSALDQVLSGHPQVQASRVASDNALIKEAAASLAKDPECYNSVLALKILEAQQAAG